MNHSPVGPSLFTLTRFAREMRMAPTRTEELLWAQLRGRKLGPRVRRQVAVQVARRHSVRGTSHVVAIVRAEL